MAIWFPNIFIVPTRTCIDMSTKSITITEDAYLRLASRKKGDESFSEVINRLTGKGSILRFAGMFSREEGERLEKAIAEGRKRTRLRRVERF